MSDYDFILENLRYSFSSVNTFDTCQYGFKLAYIDACERDSNFFSEYGLLCHEILEKYFKDELEIWDFPDYYRQRYSEVVVTPPPPYPAGMGETYYNEGLEFFENFEFDKSKFEIVFIEDKVVSKYKGIDLVVKPDLVLKDKSNGKYYLMDYKTKKLKGNKYDEKSLEEYKKQFYLYSFFLWQEKNIEISRIFIWFLRNNKKVEIPVDLFEIQEVVEWFENGIEKIKKETEWKPNNTKENQYFCKFLCSCKAFCEYMQQN